MTLAMTMFGEIPVASGISGSFVTDIVARCLHRCRFGNCRACGRFVTLCDGTVLHTSTGIGKTTLDAQFRSVWKRSITEMGLQTFEKSREFLHLGEGTIPANSKYLIVSNLEISIEQQMRVASKMFTTPKCVTLFLKWVMSKALVMYRGYWLDWMRYVCTWIYKIFLRAILYPGISCSPDLVIYNL